MTKPTIDLDNLRVAAPCPANWEQMSGNESVRFCDQCGLNVYEFSRLTRAEITSLLGSGGRLCGRLYRRADGTILTQDCPVGLRALRKRVSLKAAAAFAALLSLCSIASSQTSPNKNGKSSEQSSQWKLQEATPNSDQNPSFNFTIVDSAGAVVPRATETLTDEASNREIVLRTDERGSGSMRVPSVRSYSITVEAPGFKPFMVNHIALNADGSNQAQITLENAVTMGVVAAGPALFEPIDVTPILVEPNVRRLGRP